MTAPGDDLDLPHSVVDDFLRDHYGLSPLELRPLDSELSTVCRVDLPSGRVVMKAVRYSPEVLAVTRWQVGAMQHLGGNGIPVGHTKPNLEGEPLTIVQTPQGDAIVQVIAWLEGIPLDAAVLDRSLLLSVGDTAAQVTQLLAGWPAPPFPVAHPWELTRSLETIGATVGHVADPELRSRIEQVADWFAVQASDVLPKLPHTVIHHDLHDSNLLVDSELGRVSGVLDFGDMVVGPRIAELAVAAAYASRGADDPVTAFLDVAEGWGRRVPLTGEEISVLFVAAAARLAVNASVWASRESTSRGAYARSRSQKSGRALAALQGADHQWVSDQLHARLA